MAQLLIPYIPIAIICLVISLAKCCAEAELHDWDNEKFWQMAAISLLWPIAALYLLAKGTYRGFKQL